MNIVTKIKDWQTIRRDLTTKSIGLMTTMGNLHDGHLQLCARSVAENEITIVTVFVNPTQFNQAKDFEIYPRTLAEDTRLLSTCHVDYVLAPAPEEMYADQYTVRVTETDMSQELEGEFRPGHFDGILTVVLKFINLVQPARLYLGEKDYQQYLLIKKMVAALLLPMEVIPCATIRANDGVAFSSRNSRLSADQRAKLANLPRLLQSTLSVQQIKDELQVLGFKVEYVVDKWQRRLCAVWLDDVRLIDNVEIT